MNESSLSDDALAELLTLTVEVNERGTTMYRNHSSQLHRVHGPAVVWANGAKWWYQHDRLHRTDGPAIVYSHGRTSWYLNGEALTEEEWNERIQSL